MFEVIIFYANAEDKELLQSPKPTVPGDALNTWLQKVNQTVSALEKRVMTTLLCLEKGITLQQYDPKHHRSKAQPTVTAVTKRVSDLKKN